MARLATSVLLLAGLATSTAWGLQLGVNAGVSMRESTLDVQRRYAPFAERLAQQLNEPVEIVPIPSPQVRSVLADRAVRPPDVMVVHTHHALEMGEANNYRILGLSRDKTGTQVHFLGLRNSPVKTIADLRGRTIGLTGRDSWATAMARSELRAQGIRPESLSVYFTDYQDVAIFMLENGFAPVVATRSDKVAAEWKGKGQPVIHSGPVRPVYALMARRTLEPAKMIAVLEVFRGASDDPKLWVGLARAGVIAFDAPEAATLETLRAAINPPAAAPASPPAPPVSGRGQRAGARGPGSAPEAPQ